MKVKIGDQIYDSTEVPILLILDDADKRNIGNMACKAHKYLSCPWDYPREQAEAILASYTWDEERSRIAREKLGLADPCEGVDEQLA